MKRFALVLLLVPCTLAADEVLLRGGGRLHGIVVEHSADSIVVETGPGRITLPLARIERIVPGTSQLATYRRRAGALTSTDVQGWLELALWAQDVGLATQARAAFEHVVSLDPANAKAQRGLGNVLLGERWVTPEESLRARGYVPFEGNWVTPAERDAAMAERVAQAEAARAAQEQAARTREAEARARTAEAEARRAEADASASEAGGIPLWGSFGPGFVASPTLIALCPVCRHRHAPGPCSGSQPPVRTVPNISVPRDHAPSTVRRSPTSVARELKPEPQ